MKSESNTSVDYIIAVLGKERHNPSFLGDDMNSLVGYVGEHHGKESINLTLFNAMAADVAMSFKSRKRAEKHFDYAARELRVKKKDFKILQRIIITTTVIQ